MLTKKKLILILLVGIVVAGLLTGCQGDEPTTVYTPSGTAVSAYRQTYELTSSQIQELNNLVDTNYPNAVRETDATRMYNCHSYAWHSQSSSNNIWINAPEQEKYWTDGSYRHVATGYSGAIPSGVPNGAKVSYRSADHSAIKISSTHFRSKWGAGPRVKHTPGYCPYAADELKYYTR